MRSADLEMSGAVVQQDQLRIWSVVAQYDIEMTAPRGIGK